MGLKKNWSIKKRYSKTTSHLKKAKFNSYRKKDVKNLEGLALFTKSLTL
jgi:hypothetical protein